jgi:hypothetical protein
VLASHETAMIRALVGVNATLDRGGRPGGAA